MKSITAKFGQPTIGNRSKKSKQASAQVVKQFGKKGVTLVFVGESATKPWLKRGARIVVRGSLTCHNRQYLRVECVKPGAKKPVVVCVAPTAVKAAR